MKLKGKTAIITGSSGRLGAAIGIGLAGAGCDCVCHYNSNKQKAEKLIEQIKAAGQKAIAIKADLTEPEQIKTLFERAAEFATPQILINSAAVFSKEPLSEITFQKAQQILNLNLTAAILTSKYFAEIVNAKFVNEDFAAARIINIADIGGIRPWANYTLYCSSKAGLIGATKALAKELAPKICVNAVAPGMVNWPDDFCEDEKKRQLSFIPAGRIAATDEIAAAIIFLIENDYITGQVLNVDGGRCI